MDVPLRPTLTVDDGEAEETGFNRMIEVDLQVRFARAFRDGVAPILTISGDLDGIERREVFDVITFDAKFFQIGHYRFDKCHVVFCNMSDVKEEFRAFELYALSYYLLSVAHLSSQSKFLNVLTLL